MTVGTFLGGRILIGSTEKAGGRMIIAPEMDAIEFAYDEAKYGGCSGQPVMEIVIPSLEDASLAPDGQHVLSAHVMYAPLQLKGGWDEPARESLRERAIDTIAQQPAHNKYRRHHPHQ